MGVRVNLNIKYILYHRQTLDDCNARQKDVQRTLWSLL